MSNSKIFSRGLPGFTLVEVSLVLIIMGLVASAVFPLLKHFGTQRHWHTTKQHQQIVIKSLAGYVLKHGSLPQAGIVTPENERGLAGPHAKGIIPYRALGLSEKYAKDGYGRFMTYVVWDQKKPFSKHSGPDGLSTLPLQGAYSWEKLERFCQHQPATPLRLLSRDGQQVLEGSLGDPLAFILISHGKSGHGAFLNKGQQLDASQASSLEKFNAAGKTDFIYAPPSPDFDQTIEWVTGRNLIDVYTSSTCPLPLREVRVPGPKEGGSFLSEKL